ncbi:MAG TPA: ATPase, T2SS/T4P/T4SS family, partial [Thermodesulfobacteriota bacterium]|nr:ATPase, T2SS/T4P/T4SS family [Thermodesulfobacteriota bacterium]
AFSPLGLNMEAAGMTVAQNKKKLGEILLEFKHITEDQLAQGIEEQKISKKMLGEILREMGFVTEDKLAQALSEQGRKITPEIAAVKTRKLGEILFNYSLITKEQLAKGIEEQKRTNRRMGEVLTELGFVSEEKLARALSAQLGIPYVDLNTVVVEPEAIDLLPEKLARKNLALPLGVDRRFITVVLADPLDFEAIHDISFATNREVRPTIAPIKEIKAAIRRFYHLSQPLEKILGEIKGGSIEVIPEQDAKDEAEVMEEVAKKVDSPPIIRLVNSVIVHASRNRASDIHFEPREKAFRVRERIDGLLMEAFEFPKLVQGAVTSRLKIMARMDIAEKNIPQDGRIKVKVEGRDLDLRVSSLPSHYGEKITIRLLDSTSLQLNLSDMGPSKKDLLRMKSIVEKPQGVVLITGPTGSGKTSTLYAMIDHIKTESINIVTLEDPIEYELKGVTQVQINEKTGMTFAYALRSVLRQDPDVIMVGEMRDGETANIAFEASLTGHLVLSTLHTNTAVAAITRLKNLGIPSYLIASSLNGVLAQRLVRRICERCKEPYTPSAEEMSKLRLRWKETGHMRFYKGGGCPMCNHTGYKGRIGVYEVLKVDPAIREIIAKDAGEELILKSALENGMRYMSDDGMEKVMQGITTVSELLRVIYVPEEDVSASCPNCGESVRKDFPNCPYCGYVLVDKCPGCGDVRDPNWRFCPGCGKKFI